MLLRFPLIFPLKMHRVLFAFKWVKCLLPPVFPKLSRGISPELDSWRVLYCSLRNKALIKLDFITLPTTTAWLHRMMSLFWCNGKACGIKLLWQGQSFRIKDRDNTTMLKLYCWRDRAWSNARLDCCALYWQVSHAMWSPRCLFGT